LGGIYTPSEDALLYARLIIHWGCVIILRPRVCTPLVFWTEWWTDVWWEWRTKADMYSISKNRLEKLCIYFRRL